MTACVGAGLSPAARGSLTFRPAPRMRWVKIARLGKFEKLVAHKTRRLGTRRPRRIALLRDWEPLRRIMESNCRGPAVAQRPAMTCAVLGRVVAEGEVWVSAYGSLTQPRASIVAPPDPHGHTLSEQRSNVTGGPRPVAAAAPSKCRRAARQPAGRAPMG